MSISIDAKELKKSICSCCHRTDCSDDCGTLQLVNYQLEVDAEPVRHGKWERNPARNGLYCCSICENIAPTDGMVWEMANYCPNCGARMDGDNR